MIGEWHGDRGDYSATSLMASLVTTFASALLGAAPHSYGVEHAVRMLRRIVEGEKARGGLGYLQCEPSIISEVRTPHPRNGDSFAWGTIELIPSSTSVL